MRATRLILMIAIVVLAFGGLVMLASTSEPFATDQYGNPGYFWVRQAIWLGLAAAVCGAAVFFRDYRRLRWLAVPLMIVTAALLLYVLLFGKEINGSRRWIDLRFMMFQPSELAKPAIVLFLAWWVRRAQDDMHCFWRGLMPPMAIVGVVLFLVVREPDYGATILLALLAGVMLFAGGARLGHLLIVAAGGGGVLTFYLLQDPHRMGRITSFWNPLKYARGAAYQLVNALESFAVGGLYGVRLGEGLGKHFHLPEVHTDFILANIGEELGVFGTLSVLLLFLVIGLCGLNIARAAPDLFGRLLAVGATASLTAQAFVNIGVATGSLPTTGLALPFISYGGSNLLVNAVLVGLLLNVARHAWETEAGDHERIPFKDRLRAV